jgi:integrase
MVTLRLRYVHGFVDRTGRARFYFRYRGQRWPLPGLLGSAEFGARYDELLRRYAATNQANNVAFGPSTVGFIIEKYIASGDFNSKAPATIRIYRKILDRLKEICGGALITDLQERHVREIRKRFTSTSRGDLAVMLLGMIWTHAKEVLAMDLGINPARDIKRLHRREWSHEAWPDVVIEKFVAQARPKPTAQLALLLLLYTGQRASDVVRMRWSDYDGSGIAVRQLKTGTPLWIRCHEKLKAALDEAPRLSEFILTGRYNGYTAGGLCGMIARTTTRIGAKECTAHGLRCNAATALADSGCSVPEIMAITGHRTFREAQRYAAGRDQKKLANRAVAKWERLASHRSGKL